MITLKYVDNIYRKTVGEIELPQNLSRHEFLQHLITLYQNAGYERATEPQQLYIVNADNGLVPLCTVELITEDAVILCSAVIALNNAAEYARENGVSYYFHTSEKGHQNFPHIHARYAGEEICVYFKDYRIVGTMSARAKQREIVQYVKAHVAELQDEWDRIMQQ